MNWKEKSSLLRQIMPNDGAPLLNSQLQLFKHLPTRKERRAALREAKKKLGKQLSEREGRVRIENCNPTLVDPGPEKL